MPCQTQRPSPIQPECQFFEEGQIKIRYSPELRMWSAWLSGMDESVASLHFRGKRKLYALYGPTTRNRVPNPDPVPGCPNWWFVGRRSAYAALLLHAKAALERRNARAADLEKRWTRLRTYRALSGDGCERCRRAESLQNWIESRLRSFARDTARRLEAIAASDLG